MNIIQYMVCTHSRAVKGARLKFSCDMLRGFESHCVHFLKFESYMNNVNNSYKVFNGY